MLVKTLAFGLVGTIACSRTAVLSPNAVADCATSTTRIGSSDSSQVTWTAGEYRITTVITSLPVGRTPYVWEEGVLRLARPTVNELAASRVRALGHSPRADLRLVGTWTTKDWPRAQPAEVDGATLYVGCRDCLDGSPTKLRVTGNGNDYLWGTWRDDQSGTVRAVDPKTHEMLDQLAGPFCAIARGT